MLRSPQEANALTGLVLGPRGRVPRELLWCIEARILVFGLFLALLTVVAVGVGWVVNPQLAVPFAAMTGLNLTVGRAAGMSFGYASGLHHASVITSSVLVETIQVLMIYPLFVLSWKSLVDARRMQRLLVGVRRTAEANRSRVARYGMIGLFAFVFLPFWMTGPVVGSVIGYLIGLKARHTLPIVLSATYAAVAIWAVFFEQLNQWLAAYGRYAAFGLVLAVAGAALALRTVWAWRQEYDRRRGPDSNAAGTPHNSEQSLRESRRAGTELQRSSGIWHGASIKPIPNVIKRQYESSSRGQRTPDGRRRAPPSLTIAQSHRDRQPTVLRRAPPDQAPCRPTEATREIQSVRTCRVDEMTAGLAGKPKPIQHPLEFPLTHGRNEVEVT